MMEPLKERLRHLMAIRDTIEKEIEERLARLEGPGGAGRSGSLVDAEVRDTSRYEEKEAGTRRDFHAQISMSMQ